MAPIPITIVTGFLGSGKTTLILKLLPQLPAGYKVALLKNEFGDVAVDSKLAGAASVSGVRELLNGCICCNLVGQLGDALATLARDHAPDRIVIETSGSAFPATLALEVNRLAKEEEDVGGDGEAAYVLDGVVSVVDVENWQGYEDTSYTARMQARYTDLVVLNKWEAVGERRVEDCEDRLLDLLDPDVPRIKSDAGRVPYDVLVGLDSGLAKAAAMKESEASHDHDHEHGHDDHQSEVNVLSLTLPFPSSTPTAAAAADDAGLDVQALDTFLRSAPREDIYRIKAIFWATQAPLGSDGQRASSAAATAKDGKAPPPPQQYVLNWAFGRWTVTALGTERPPHVLEMTVVTARGEAAKWQRRIETNKPFKIGEGGADGDATMTVKRVL